MVVRKKISWFDLHPDMLSLIKSRLFVGDITTFNMICRPWRSITTTSRIFRPLTDSSLPQTPSLVTLHNGICEFYNPLYAATYKLDTPQLSDARILSSGYGWLLLARDDHETVFFFNPFTGEEIHLPAFPRRNMLVITFSSPPTSRDCFVIGLTHSGVYTMARAITIRRGDASWVFHDFLDNGHENGYAKFLGAPYCSPVFHNDKCYFLGETGNIGVFDVKAAENMWQVFGKARRARVTRPVSMVLEEDGTLLAVFLSRERREVLTCRSNLSKMVWGDVESLGSDKMLYVSDGTSFLEACAPTGMGNKFYFPFFAQNNIGIFYSMSTKMYHSHDRKYCTKSPFDLVEPGSSNWIKPVYSQAAKVEDLKWC